MGRGHESQVRVNDISVSRTHAVLKFRKDDGIYLSDNKSKFGTLILLRQTNQQLDKDKNYMFQVGRTVCSLRVVAKPDLSQGSSFAGDDLSSAEHGQTEPFCSSQSSDEDNHSVGNPEEKRCQSSREAAAAQDSSAQMLSLIHI